MLASVRGLLAGDVRVLVYPGNPPVLCEPIPGLLTEPRFGETRDIGTGEEMLVNRSGMIEPGMQTELTNGVKVVCCTFVSWLLSVSIVVPLFLV